MANEMAGLRVLTLGGRAAVDICADLLCRAGAAVEKGLPPIDPVGHDVILFSSDRLGEVDRDALRAMAGQAILCDIATSYAGSADGPPLSDSALQARSGLMDVTGFADGAPTATALPMIELSGALYAASLVTALCRSGQDRARVSVSLLGCAVSTLTTFLPRAFIGERAGRIGNRHPACAPWNAYPTRDGHVLICTSSDEQWLRLRARTNLTELLAPRFDRLADRLAAVDEIDRLMTAWTETLTTADCLGHCEAAGIPAGPIISPGRLWQEANFRFRHPAAAAAQEGGAAALDVAALVELVHVEPLMLGLEAARLDGVGGALPLTGLRVLELGQYTTVPLATRHLATLGAEVIKVEPPSGEVARRWIPTRDGMSYYFAITNSDKSIEFLDLSQEPGRKRLEELVGSAHVLIENMRPGALGKLGFDRARLAALNPSLVYCAVSGFGSRSAYPGRPAFDTVVQGMGGLMELTPSAGRPVKLGVSAADILGAQLVLYALLANLPRGGLFIDVAMQDIAAWSSIAADFWPAGEGRVFPCLDGALWLEGSPPSREAAETAALKSLPRVLARARLAELGIRAHPVARVDELLLDPLLISDVFSVATEDGGAPWPSLCPPYRIEGRPFAPPRIPRRLDGSRERG